MFKDAVAAVGELIDNAVDDALTVVVYVSVTGFTTPKLSSVLVAGGKNPLAGETLTVSASSTALSISSPTAATASLNNVQAVTTQPVGATFSPISGYNAPANQFSSTGLTINFVNAQGNPALNAWVNLDGATQVGSTAVSDGASINHGALWLTSIDGTSLSTLNTAGTSVPDAFPLVSPTHGVSNYQAPQSSSMFYPVVAGKNTFMKVNTGPNGSVTVGLQGGGADYYTGSTEGTSAPLSGSNTYFLGVWNPNVPTGYDAYLNSFAVGNAVALWTITGMSSLTSGTYTIGTSSYAQATATITVKDANGNPITGLTGSDFTVSSTGHAAATYTAVSSPPAAAANDFTLSAGTTAGSYSLTVYSSHASWGSSATSSTVSISLNDPPYTSNTDSHGV